MSGRPRDLSRLVDALDDLGEEESRYVVSWLLEMSVRFDVAGRFESRRMAMVMADLVLGELAERDAEVIRLEQLFHDDDGSVD